MSGDTGPDISLAALDGASPIRILRQRLDDLFAPRPAIYWLDFIGSMALFWIAFAVALGETMRSPVKYAALTVAILALYRAAVFVHELMHLRRGDMLGFRAAWNLICGIPLLMPSFTYGNHGDHHAPHRYGTADDGEYRTLATGPRSEILALPLLSLLLPPLAAFRFMILSPLAWASPSIRRWVDAKASSLVIDPSYVRQPVATGRYRQQLFQEIATFIYLGFLGLAVFTGKIGTDFLLQLYVTIAAVLFLNALRTLAAHRYRSPGAPLSLTEQYLDSVNYPRRSWFIPLWAPVGLRFHALHHLFPGIPYHNLRVAHERLVRLLPPDSAYHRTAAHGLVGTLLDLWRGARPVRGKPAGSPFHGSSVTFAASIANAPATKPLRSAPPAAYR